MRLPLRPLILSIAVLAAATSVQSQLPSDLKAQLWPAKWITSDDAPARDEAVLYFRKRVELSNPPHRFVVNVSADNRFVLYVNGQRAGSGPARSDLAHWHYETFDIGPLLKSGENVFAAVVWNFGARSALAQISDRTAFLLGSASEADNAVNTGTDWDVAVEKADSNSAQAARIGWLLLRRRTMPSHRRRKIRMGMECRCVPGWPRVEKGGRNRRRRPPRCLPPGKQLAAHC